MLHIKRQQSGIETATLSPCEHLRSYVVKTSPASFNADFVTKLLQSNYPKNQNDIESEVRNTDADDPNKDFESSSKMGHNMAALIGTRALAFSVLRV